MKGERPCQRPNERVGLHRACCGPLRRVASGVGEKPVRQGAESLQWSSICRAAEPCGRDPGAGREGAAAPELEQGQRANEISCLLGVSYVLVLRILCVSTHLILTEPYEMAFITVFLVREMWHREVN